MGTPDGLEIERKFLLAAAPPAEVLAARAAAVLRIEQVYLRPEPGSDARRVRRIDHPDGRIERVYTEKRQLHGIVREERERPLDEAGYDALLAEADPERRPIRKTRHVIPHGGHRLELDVFEVPPGLVLLEVELAAPDEPVELPGWVDLVREVSEDPAFLNWSLARRPPA